MSNSLKENLNIADMESGCRLSVKAKPGARKTGITGLHDGALKIAVNAAPEKGKANQALCKFLAKLLSVPASKIDVISGQTNSQKSFYIPLSVDDVLTILTEKEPDL